MANIKDIAEEAGVSIATVSRALRKPGLVRPETAQRITDAINKLAYTPNLIAASLRRQRADAVIVAVPDISNPFTSSFVQGIENIARENDIKVLLGLTEGRPDLLDRHYDMVTSKQADGMIVLDVNRPSIVARRKPGDPALPIVVACEYEGDIDLPRVRIDDIEAAALAARHIAELGHRAVAIISGPNNQRMSQDRQRGFRLGLRRCGVELDPLLVVKGDYSIQSGVDAATRLLDTARPITAILCENDEMAVGAIYAVAMRGLSIPDDISVIGIDNLRFAEFANPGLTTIALPTTAIGEQAMRLMLDFTLEGETLTREVIMPHELIVRASTAPPR